MSIIYHIEQWQVYRMCKIKLNELLTLNNDNLTLNILNDIIKAKGSDIMSPQSKAHIKASNKYNAKTYERLNILVKKGERERIKAYAEAKGMSLNAYVTGLIYKDMEKEKE